MEGCPDQDIPQVFCALDVWFFLLQGRWIYATCPTSNPLIESHGVGNLHCSLPQLGNGGFNFFATHVGFEG